MAALGDAFFVQTFTTTLQRYEKQLVDNVLKEHPVLELFKSTAKSITGRGLVIPLRAANLGATGYTDASGTHTTAASSDIMGSAVYDWANEIVTPFRLKHRDILQNSGPEQIVSLVEEYVKAAQADHSDFIVEELHKLDADWATGKVLSMDMLFKSTDKISTTVARSVGGIRGGKSVANITDVGRSAGGVATLATNGTHDFIVGDSVVVAGVTTAGFNGTFTITAVGAGNDTFSYANAGATVSSTADATGTGTVGAVKDYWKATRYTSSAASEDIAAAFRKVTNLIFKESRKRPTHIICGFDVYEAFEAYLATKGQIPTGGDNINTRWSVLKFGDQEVRLDPDCQDDRAYFINQPSLRFAYCAGEFMKSYPAQPLEGTLDTVVPIASTILFGVAERRANGLLVRTA
jgi:hypothetical protein